jgi:hypothetical protein
VPNVVLWIKTDNVCVWADILDINSFRPVDAKITGRHCQQQLLICISRQKLAIKIV